MKNKEAKTGLLAAFVLFIAVAIAAAIILSGCEEIDPRPENILDPKRKIENDSTSVYERDTTRD